MVLVLRIFIFVIIYYVKEKISRSDDMGTRGAYGFYKNSTNKIGYVQYDAYPEGLGEDVVKFINSSNIAELNSIFNKINVVDENTKPTDEDVEKTKPWHNLSVSRQSTNDWYCLLREAQGDLNAFRDGLEYILDSADFLKSSLFCEWGYVINLDTNMFEVYKGFQKEPDNNPNNRYIIDEARDMGYWHCKLIAEFPLSHVPSNWSQTLFEEENEEEVV